MYTQARQRGLEFLLRARGDDGWWRDWDSQGGISDEWVTAYTACELAANGLDTRACAELAFERLRDRRPALDGWSYNHRVPPDADSTAWACRLAHLLHRAGEVGPAISFLHQCRRADGGLATYPSAGRVRHAMHWPRNASFRGWLAAHTCVTATAAALPEFGCRPEVFAYLLRNQEPDGHWEGYWWPDPEYATALAVEALLNYGTAAGQAAVHVAVEWARALGPTESAFALACRIRILRCHDWEACLRIRDALLELQNPDGSWPSSARIRIPPPDFLDPSSIWNWDEDRKDIYSIRRDQERIFTTASVLKALAKL